MADTIQGLGGGVTLPTGFAGKVSEWIGDIDYGEVDVSGFDDAGYYNAEATLITLRGSARAIVLNTSAPIPSTLFGTLGATAFDGVKGTLTIISNTSSKQFTGTAMITGVNLVRPFANAPHEITFNFVYCGAISIGVWS